jgi:peptide deformylase
MLKNLNDLLLLGDDRLYQVCDPILYDELDQVPSWIADMDNVMKEVREKYHFGRAIAAPQLGIMKRLVYMNIDRPVIFINPILTFCGEEQFELWDDCMSFPNLLVKIKRYRFLTVNFKDENWQDQKWDMSDSLAELLQHEVDHLDGILCTMRAIDDKSFKWRSL